MSTRPGAQPRVAVITGSAGTLGTALVHAFLDAGFHVYAAWRRTPPSLAPHRNLTPLPLDVTDRAAWSHAAQCIGGRHPAVQALVHAAGQVRDHLLVRTPTGDWDALMDVHARACADGTRALLPLLQAGAPAHVVVVASHASRLGHAGQSAYAASKAAAIGLSRALAVELAPDGICVNAVCPGVLEGPMTRDLSPDARHTLVGANLLGRASEPHEVARFIAFLAGMRQVSGQVFHLDSRPVPWA